MSTLSIQAAHPTAIEVTMTVPGAHTWTDCRGVEFTVEKVEHRAYIYKGRYVQTSTLHGTTTDGGSTNATLNVDYDEFPSWVPDAPQGWHDIAATILSSVEAVAR